MKILTYPDKKLKQKSKKVRKVTKEIRELALNMIKIMKENKGVGLSAIQLGIPIRLLVTGYEIPKDADQETQEKLKDNEQIPTLILVNPKVTLKSRQTSIMKEGCLSCPDVELPVKRPLAANILATDLDGHRVKIRAKGLLARVLLHEIDHLDGILIYDRTDKKTLKRLREKQNKQILDEKSKNIIK